MRLVALVAAAVLGVSAGIVTAFVVPNGLRGADAPQTTPSPTDFDDPLDLGIPLVNVGCTGETLILVGWGEDFSALSASAADWRGVQYLETAGSCATVYPQVRDATPTYAAYLPPFATPSDACEERMDASHKRDFVTRMNAGNQDNVPCACVLDVTTLPIIGEGQPLTTESGMWTFLYQSMLDDIGALELPEVQAGSFDDPTIEATRLFQTNEALSPLGYVDTDTWGQLREKTCRRYVY